MKPRDRQLVPFSDFEPLFNTIRAALECNQDETMKAIGYNGTTLSSWRNDDAVPQVALNSARWVLHDLQMPQPTPKPASQFTLDELTDLLLAIRGTKLDAETKTRLITKIAKAIAGL